MGTGMKTGTGTGIGTSNTLTFSPPTETLIEGGSTPEGGGEGDQEEDIERERETEIIKLN